MTPSAKRRMFSTDKAQGKHRAKLYHAYRKVDVGPATPRDEKCGLTREHFQKKSALGGLASIPAEMHPHGESLVPFWEKVLMRDNNDIINSHK